MDLSQIYASESGQLIRKHLESVIDQMDKITNINKNLSKDEIAITTLANIQTIEKLKEILQLTAPIKDKSPIKMEAGKKYGL
jgi:hypothetical protein